MKTNRRRGAAILLVGLLGLALTACGGDDNGGHGGHDAASGTQTAPNGDVFNDADVEFATHMIPHHAQAVQMVVMAQDRPLDPEVAELANNIRDAQVPEVETMTGWLTDWGKEVPETPLDHVNAGHDMEDMTSHEMEGMDGVPGMMSAEEMQALQDASDAEFQGMWLEMMIEHHEGAIEMAQTEQEEGEFADAVALAEAIIAAQESEIAAMDGLLEPA